MATRASLLAEDDNDPALSGPPNSAVEEESALSRLITESTPPTALAPFSAALDETTQSTTWTTIVGHQKASLITILAGTLISLQWGFIWGAYFSTSWMDIHLQIYIGWQEKFLPWLDKHTDLVLQQMSVFTLSDNLKQDKAYGSLAGIWFCSVVLPCVFMIVCPIWILTDYTAPPQRCSYALGQPLSRLWLEWLIRLSWLAAIILLTLNVAISGIELQWEGTDLQVHNAFTGPYVSYVLGCSCALATVVLLRIPYLEHWRLLSYPGQKPKRNPRQVAADVPEPPPPQARFAPPANAFQLPWLSSSINDEEQDNAEAQQPLLQDATATPSRQQPKPQWKNWIIFQLGLLSFLLWFPGLALAQFRVLYSGLVMDMVTTPAYNVYVWELPQIIWNTGRRASTPVWILVLTGILLGLFGVVFPLLAHGVAIKTWMHGGTSKWRDALTLLHPTLCGIPFAAGILVTAPSFVDIGENIDSDICFQIENTIENQCLISGGIVLWGCYFLFAQAICLEAFVLLTLWWTAPPRPPTNTV